MTINLSVQSGNNKLIYINELLSNTNLNTTSQNITVPLEYNNILVDIQTSTDVQLTDFWSNVDNLTGSGIYIFMMLISIILLIASIKFIKRL